MATNNVGVYDSQENKIYSTAIPTKPIITIPITSAQNCFNDSNGSSSFKRSGRTVTKAI